MLFLDVKCSECEGRFDLDQNEIDEGDPVDCPDCGAGFKVKIVGEEFKLVTHKEEIHDFDEIEYEEE